MKILVIFCMLLPMTATFTATAAAPAVPPTQPPEVARTLAWLGKNLEWVTEQQIRLTEIPAPPFHEGQRAAAVRDLLASLGLPARVDAAGNVVAELRGADADGVVLVCAHLDTVFPQSTEIRVRHDGPRLLAPGIADNGAGLAALVTVARAFQESRLRTRATLVFAADVGEEGEGNLRGIRELVNSYGKRLRDVIAIDGASTDHITTMALASRRIEVTVSGPGGHSWSDFGAPNPIDALARGIVRFADTRLPAGPRSTFNIGSIEGGTSVNAIPERASIKVDLRSESPAELDDLEKDLRAAIAAGVEAESTASRGGDARLAIRYRVIGVRPGGELPANSPLLQAVQEVDRTLGLSARLERSSTDANIPLSLGIPAIAIGGGGSGGAAHSLDEWYDPTGREVGLERIVLTLVAVAGLAP